MKIASVTVFCNETFRLKPWIKYFSEYRDDIYVQVIVNNGSVSDNLLLREAFPDAVILHSDSSNMISSYNLAVNYILYNTDADTILQITNDVKIESGGLKTLYNLLLSNSSYGLISPILLQRDSDLVENYGAEINFDNMLFQHIDRGKRYDDISEDVVVRTGLPGGCFLIKKQVFEIIGLQDKKINMYSDEVDLGIKCLKSGYKLLSTKLVKSWHQHIFPEGKNLRSRRAYYLMARNPIYIAKKYFNIRIVFKTFFSRFKLSMIDLLSCIYHFKGMDAFLCSMSSIKGCFVGLLYK